MEVENAVKAIQNPRPLIVAVSGGIDSVVLLHALWQVNETAVVVVHVDHGIRHESAADERFVRALAGRCGYEYESTQLKLGPDASEDQARQQRYQCIEAVARNYRGTIVTAHHRDDVVETIAINLIRGTRWRGLGVMSRDDIARPFLALPKQTLRDYASRHCLEWCEDETNKGNTYLRNRLRRTLSLDEKSSQQLLLLRQKQLDIRQAIDEECAQYDTAAPSRYWMTMVPPHVGCEMVRYRSMKDCGCAPLTRQLERAVLAIRTGQPGTTYQLGSEIVLTLTKKQWSVHREAKGGIMKDDRRFEKRKDRIVDYGN